MPNWAEFLDGLLPLAIGLLLALFFGTTTVWSSFGNTLGGQPEYRSETGNLTEHSWWRDGTFCGKNEGQHEGASYGRETHRFLIAMIGTAPRLD